MNNKNNEAERNGKSYPPRPQQGDRFGIRSCGCPIPKDYPKIDIHNNKCKRRRWLEGPPVGNKGEIPKVYPSGRKLSGSDAPRTVTPTHHNSKQWFFGHDYSAFVDPKGSVWLAMAKRFDKRFNKP